MEIDKIVNVCKETECDNCPLFYYELDNCILDEEVPCRWDLEEIERRMKNYGEKEKN